MLDFIIIGVMLALGFYLAPIVLWIIIFIIAIIVATIKTLARILIRIIRGNSEI